jgi:hypothetical protein
MTIEDKIKYIEQTGLGFLCSVYHFGISFGAVAFTSQLFNKKLINIDVYNKLKIISETTNFPDNYWNKKSLNSNSILWANLVYNILKTQQINEKIHNKTR